jgi:hypothetical protein
MIRERAAEKDRDREASQNAQPGTTKLLSFEACAETSDYVTRGFGQHFDCLLTTNYNNGSCKYRNYSSHFGLNINYVSQHKRLQFTFSVDVEQRTPAEVPGPDHPISSSLDSSSPKRSKINNGRPIVESNLNDRLDGISDDMTTNEPSLTQRSRQPAAFTNDLRAQSPRLPPLFSNDFGPAEFDTNFNDSHELW